MPQPKEESKVKCNTVQTEMTRLGREKWARSEEYAVRGPDGWLEVNGDMVRTYATLREAALAALNEAVARYLADEAEWERTKQAPVATRKYEVVWTTTRQPLLQVRTDW